MVTLLPRGPLVGPEDAIARAPLLPAPIVATILGRPSDWGGLYPLVALGVFPKEPPVYVDFLGP